MPRTAQEPGRTATPPQQPTVYEEVWNTVTKFTPDFPPPGEKESNQAFTKRLARAVSNLPPDAGEMSDDAEAWYNGVVDGKIVAPPGFLDDDDADDATAEVEADEADETDGDDETEADEVEVAPTPEPNEQRPEEKARAGTNGVAAPSAKQAASRSAGAERLRKYREEKAATAAAPPAAKAAPAASKRRTPVAAPVEAPAPTSRRRKAAAPTPAPAAPAPAPARRRAVVETHTPAPAPTAAPRRAKVAAAPPAPAAPGRRRKATDGDAGTSIARFARLYIVEHPETSLSDLIAATEAAGYSATRSTMAGNLTFMKNALDVVKETGHWRD